MQGAEAVKKLLADIDLEQLYAKNPDIILINQRGDKGATEEQLMETVGGNAVVEKAKEIGRAHV